MTPTETLPSTWESAEPGPVRVGSEAHKEMFCRMLLDTHDPYRPAIMEWPSLEPDALARITGLPFWTIAVETENRAAANIELFAQQTADPLLREALEMMVFEERRHREVLEALVRHYGIEIGECETYTPPPRAEWSFTCTGYGECLDSFFAFGLFELANRSGYFPPELVETFEPVIQEEARHIVFFINWAAYRQAKTPLLLRPWFAVKRIGAVINNVRMRLNLGLGDDDMIFATAGKDSLGLDIKLKHFMGLCLSENERRFSRLDPRLRRPLFMPRLVRAARLFMR